MLALMISASNAGAAEISLPADGATPPGFADFDQAVRLYTAGHYAEARDLLARIYSVKLTAGQNQLVRFLSGVTAFKLGRFDEVEKFLSGQGRVPPSLKDHSLYLQGQACFLAGQYSKARDLLGEFARRFPDSLQVNQVHLTRAEALFHLGRPLKALEECRVLAKKDRDGRVRLAMARIYESLGRLAEARSNYYLAMENSNTGAVRSEAAKRYKELLAPALDQPGREEEKRAMVRVLRREWRLDETLDLIDRLRSEGGKADFLGKLNSE
ncbi:MAG: tetratricopeptide repeat protein, partial [Thermodesulfobacteriota bacterium]|nr:tetratricopeptide repeat protein [Thermodesulfobacteriota bacterium]